MCIREAHDGPHGAAAPPLRGVQAQLQDLQQPEEAQALRPQPGQAVRLPGLPSQVYTSTTSTFINRKNETFSEAVLRVLFLDFVLFITDSDL
jgi:hypothetical protein